jgi:hypothetical protein
MFRRDLPVPPPCDAWRTLLELVHSITVVGLADRKWANLDEFRSDILGLMDSLRFNPGKSLEPEPQVPTPPSLVHPRATGIELAALVPILAEAGKWCVGKLVQYFEDRHASAEIKKSLNLDTAVTSFGFIQLLIGRISTMAPAGEEWATNWSAFSLHSSHQLVAMSKWLVSFGGEAGPIIETTFELVRLFEVSEIPSEESWPNVCKNILSNLEKLSSIIRSLIAKP